MIFTGCSGRYKNEDPRGTPTKKPAQELDWKGKLRRECEEENFEIEKFPRNFFSLFTKILNTQK